ncbi:MAG: HAD family hydrolase [Treponema sp.]|jgi:putative hydrolase of the HAD superfamily|nr:HAD family hydrolase [Treponema sp.]
MIRMERNIDGIAFDLDGTFYPDYRFYVRLVPFILRECRLLLAMGKARSALRENPEEGDFYDLQARIMAKILRKDPQTIKERTERLIYRNWEPLFKKVKPYPHVRETLENLHKGGFKLGLLSDFPPEKKLEYLGLADHWDTILCSESTGRLKPHSAPFGELAKSMGLPPERILYVGNSVKYDIIGAKRAGMKAALVSPCLLKKRRHRGNADFIFSDYRQLYTFVLS